MASAARSAAGAAVRAVRSVSPRGARALSAWSSIPEGPVDAIFGLNLAFAADPSPHKVNVGVGAYRDDEGKPFVLSAVMEAERRMADMDHEYAGIGGIPNFVNKAVELALGEDCEAIADGRVGAIQSVSGTGALNTAGQFVRKFVGENTPLYLPNPTWGNHKAIFTACDLDVRQYRYYDPSTIRLDFDGLLADLEEAPDKSFVLLHTCAHNPTGIDPTVEQWDAISKLLAKKQMRVIFDNAYQGFASGNLERDAYSLRKFVADGHNVIICQSFSKNFGLYGERAGVVSVVTCSPEEAKAVESQLKIIVRPIYSNPPIHGARIVDIVLGDPELRAAWFKDCKHMAEQIDSRRQLLRSEIEKLGSSLDWSHMTSQIGMFCYSGLDAGQVTRIREEFSVYMTNDGRISMAGVTTANAEYLARALHGVTKDGPTKA